MEICTSNLFCNFFDAYINNFFNGFEISVKFCDFCYLVCCFKL